MQPLNALRGYSEFFKSGFRAFTNRCCGQSFAFHDATLTPRSSRMTSSDSTKRRLRSVSMIVQNTPREKARRRRTSFLSFSSRFSTTSSNESSTISPRSSICSLNAGDSLPEVWMYTAPALNESFDEKFCRSIDPFSSSPDAKSIFLDFSQDDSVLGISKRDFFPTLSSNRSSIITHCERPLSIQTISSLQSTLQYYPPLARDKSDFFGVIEEESDFLHLSEVMESGHDGWDAPSRIDWRQFHVDVLSDSDM